MSAADFHAFRARWLGEHRDGDAVELSVAWQARLAQRASGKNTLEVVPTRSESPHAGCAGLPSRDEYLRVVELAVNALDAPRHSAGSVDSVSYAVLLPGGESAVVVGLRRDGDKLRATRYALRVEARDDEPSTWQLLIAKDEQRLSAVDAWAVARVWLGSLGAKRSYASHGLMLAAYRARGCPLDDARERLRAETLYELSTVLGAPGSALGWLRDGEPRVEPGGELAARLMLYAWVKLAHEPEGTRRDVVDVRELLRGAYTRQLSGQL